MADVKVNPVFEGFSKQIGDLVFFQSNGKTFVKRKGNPGNPRTLKQMSVRTSFSELISDWSSLTGIMHEGWNLRGKKKKMRGNNVFVKDNFQNQRIGSPIQLFHAVGKLVLSNFSAAPGSSGEILCSYTNSGVNAGNNIYFFTKKLTMGIASGEIVMHNGGDGTLTQHTITGLEPGAGYCIYAIVTDAEYSIAVEVSASIGVIASAGI